MEPKRNLTLDQIDLSDFEFWTRPYDEREGAFLTLRGGSVTEMRPRKLSSSNGGPAPNNT